jgi:hypothetical protein
MDPLLKRFFSVVLILSLFFSITGYMIPCTLHCLHAQSDHRHTSAEMEMNHNHDMDNVRDCNGMCSIDKHSSPDHDAAGMSAMQLTQFMSQMFTATLCNASFLTLPPQVHFFNPVKSLQFASWITGPPSPPPRFSLLLS